MFHSDLPGNGKTFQIRKYILDRENRDRPPARSEYNEELGIPTRRHEGDWLTDGDLDRICANVLISGELTRESIQSRLAKLKHSRRGLKYLVLKLDFMSDLQGRGHILNDILFYLCYFGCIYSRDVPCFLPDPVRILVEVQTYHENYLYHNVSFLRNLPETALRFDLQKLQIGASIECRIQSACFFLHHTIKNRDCGQFRQFPITSLFSQRAGTVLDDAIEPFALERGTVLETLSTHYVDSEHRSGQVTFAGLILFCEMVGYEFRNLNNNNLLNTDSEVLEVDIRSRKPLVFQLVRDICIRAINPSINASTAQQETVDRLNGLDNE